MFLKHPSIIRGRLREVDSGGGLQGRFLLHNREWGGKLLTLQQRFFFLDKAKWQACCLSLDGTRETLVYVNMYLCVYIYIYILTHIYVYIYIYIHIYIHFYVYMYMHVCMIKICVHFA